MVKTNLSFRGMNIELEFDTLADRRAFLEDMRSQVHDNLAETDRLLQINTTEYKWDPNRGEQVQMVDIIHCGLSPMEARAIVYNARVNYQLQERLADTHQLLCEKEPDAHRCIAECNCLTANNYREAKSLSRK